MTILIEDNIHKAIEKCAPSHIAVAYIGKDWKAFVKHPEKLESIIVSPTIGSNPFAIKELASEIGWSKIYFLDGLHAKIYLGVNCAVVGSANLTHNGLSGDSLYELSVEITNKAELRDIQNTINKLMEKSEKHYPTENDKKNKIIELEKSWSKAISNGIFSDNSMNHFSFSNFELLSDDQFYIVWYQYSGCEYSEDIMAIKSLLGDDLHFHQSDNVETNKWALTWKITNKSKPHKLKHLQWLYIDEIFDNGIIDKDYDYTKCAFERNDKIKPTPPFKITKEVETAFKKAVIEKDIAKYLIQEQKEIFSLQYSFKGLPKLINKMKKYITLGYHE